MRIGVFDSGSGGLTVLAQLKKRLPECEYIYFGDYENMPYGDKPPEFIKSRATAITRNLIDQGAQLIVVACNTVSAIAMEELKKMSSVPIIGVIEPTKEFLAKQRFKRIGLAATTATVKSSVYNADVNVACPDLVPLIEELDKTIHKYFSQLRDVDAVILGCTHYPLVEGLIKRHLGDVPIINPAVHTAQSVLEFLDENNWRKTSRTKT